MMQSIGGIHYYIDGLVQYCSISSALAMKVLSIHYTLMW